MRNNNPDDHKEDLQSSLLQNAYDYMLSASESVFRNEGPRSLKESVIHSANGLELVLKARLVSEHWSLIFQDVNNASIEHLTKADFVSVNFSTAVSRLKKIAGVSINKTSELHINNLRDLRNQLTHFNANLDPAQAKSLVAKTMAFCLEFCEQQDMTIPDLTSKTEEIHNNLIQIQEFVDARITTIANQWAGSLIWECPDCWQEALVIDGESLQCKFCNSVTTPRTLADRYSQGELEDCPECGEEMTFAFIVHNNDSAGWQCFSCGEGGQHYDHCMRCGAMGHFPRTGEPKVCGNCWSNILNRE